MPVSVRRTPARHIATQQTPGSSAQTRVSSSTLPQYEPPSFSLNPSAQRTLAQLIESHNLSKLDKKYSDAQASITLNAGEINDRLTQSAQIVAKRKRKRVEQQAGSQDEPNRLEQGLDELKEKVERMTQRMDEHMRKLIDGQHSVQAIRESAAGTAEDARANASTQASTQNVRSQRRTRRASAGSSDEDGDEDYQDFTPTDPTSGTQVNPTAVEAFRSKLDNAKTRYQSHSLRARYSENNDYASFKKVVHDARDPDGETQLPHHSEWFAEEGQAPAPGVTTRGRSNEEDPDDDDDIAVSRIKISTKCPLTLQEFKEPVTSRKCPHSFESTAIMGMIDMSTLRVGGHVGARGQTVGGEKAVQCPVGGCRETLRKADLHVDAVLIRQIKRIQRAKELEEEDAEDETEGDGKQGRTQRQAFAIDDDEDEDGADVDAIVERQTQMKTEPRSTAAPTGHPGSAAPRSTESSVLVESEEDERDEDATMED